MRAKPVAADKQYRLVMECRSSGLTDYQWCLEHDIKPGTFYNWAKHLRQKGCVIIPPAARSQNPVKQEIVEISIQRASDPILEVEAVFGPFSGSASIFSEIPVIELLLSGATVRIPQGTDADFLKQVLQTVRRVLC